MKTHSTQDSLPMSVVHIACIDRVTEWIKPATLSEVVLGKAACPAHIRPTVNAQHTATSLITKARSLQRIGYLIYLATPSAFLNLVHTMPLEKGTFALSLRNLACQNLSNA